MIFEWIWYDMFCQKEWHSQEAVAQVFSAKKVFLEISQNSQKNTCARFSFLIKLQASGTGVFLWISWNF